MGCRLNDFFKKKSIIKRVLCVIAFLATVAGLAGLTVWYIRWAKNLNQVSKDWRTKTYTELFNIVASCCFFCMAGCAAWVVWFIFWNFECCKCLGIIFFWAAMGICLAVLGFAISLAIKVKGKYYCINAVIWGDDNINCRGSFVPNVALLSTLGFGLILDLIMKCD